MKRENLTLIDKCVLLSGKKSWYTANMPEKDIPAITLHDGPHGVRIENVTNTIYPNLCLLGCSFDRDVLYTIGNMIGNDCIKNKVDVLLAPGVNLKRTVTGGRNFEYLSEDGLLVGELASAYVNGVQATGTSATVKHFCCNNQENYRMSTSSDLDTSVLFNTYLKPFGRVIEKAKPDCIMTSYNLVNGERTNESAYLQKTVLRDKLGFTGVVMSDWGAITDKPLAVKGGCDLEMPGGNSKRDVDLSNAVVNGAVDIGDIDTAVNRVLNLVEKHANTQKIETQFDDKEEVVANTIAESIVMLKNNGILPLKKKEKIGVYGNSAKSPRIQGGGCAQIKIENILSPLELLSKEFEIVFVPTGGDIQAFNGVDKVIAFVTGECTDSEAYDRDNLKVNENELADLVKINAINENICVVLQNGGVLEIDNLPSKAILETYYAGEFFAKGLMKVLLGKSPCGRLAESFPLKLEHSPSYLGGAEKLHTPYMEGDYIGYKYYCKKQIPVAYPFGFGLSYANIVYTGFNIYQKSLTDGGKILGVIELENKSDIESKEVLQIYYDDGKIKNLVYFDKVLLKAGEKRKIDFEISYKEFVKFDGDNYSIPNETGVLMLSKNANEVIFTQEVTLTSSKKPKINKNMLIEDIVNLVGVKKVAEYFSKPIGLAFYADETFVLPAENGVLSDNEMDRKNSMMMPLKNLTSYSDKYTDEDLDRALIELQDYLDNLKKD